MTKASVEIHSTVNEIFAKTIITQKLLNDSESPLELKIYVYKSDMCIFSSFTAQIGDSIKVKSKVIKEEKAAEKYTDSIASGNAAIFVSKDPMNENKIIINMGNIPKKEEIIFISEFIQYTESSEGYEFELFRNLPIFAGKSEVFENNDIKGKVEIKVMNKIINIKKNLLNEKLKIIEERYLNEQDKKEYIIKYEYNNLEKNSNDS